MNNPVIEFVVEVTKSIPHAEPEDFERLIKAAKTIDTHNLYYSCDWPISKRRENALDRATETVAGTAEKWGVEIETRGDPRYHPVLVRLPSGKIVGVPVG